MKLQYLFILVLGAVLFNASTCKKEDPNDPCILKVDIGGTPLPQGSNIMASASDGLEPYTYLWNTGETTQIIVADVYNTYSVTVTDDIGCTASKVLIASECVLAVTDIDGWTYNVVRIGNQCWTTHDLNTTHFRNGDPITEISVQDNASWQDIFDNQTELPAWSSHSDTANFDGSYGYLYNWYAVNDPRGLAPEGWHVATLVDYEELFDEISYLHSGADLNTAGGYMKSTNSLWYPPNTGADNSTGFSAIPGGLRWMDGLCTDRGLQAFYWTSTEVNANNAAYINLFYNSASVLPDQCFKEFGFSVRLVHD